MQEGKEISRKISELDDFAATDVENNLVTIFSEIAIDKRIANRLKTLLIDELGCIIAGRRTELSKDLQEEANLPKNLSEKIRKWKDELNNKECEKLMALASGSFSTELNQTHLKSITHPGSVVVPTALYLAGKEKITWNSFLESILTGYEVMTSLGDYIGQGLYRRSRHPTGTLGIFGAMATVAKLKQISAEEFREFLSIASSLALSDFYKLDEKAPLLKVVNPGIAAADGISIVEGNYRAISNNISFEKFVSRYIEAQSYDKKERGIFNLFFKKYPVVCAFHAILEPLIDMIREYDLHSDEIKQVIVRYHKIPTKFYSGKTIIHKYEAQASLPYAIAIALQGKKCGLSDFQNSEVIGHAKELLSVIDITPEGFTAFDKLTGGKITIKTAKGNYSRGVLHAKGLALEDIQKKFFKSCLFGRLKKGTAQQIIEIIKNEAGNPLSIYKLVVNDIK